jgi:hypothetical protein
VITTLLSEPGTAVHATCPAGTRLAGGGYTSQPAVNGSDEPIDFVIANHPSADRANTWSAQLLKGRVRARALCLK